MEFNGQTMLDLDGWRAVYGMLEDQASRDIYLNRLNYLVSQDYRYIDNIVKRYLPQMQSWEEAVRGWRKSMPEDRKIVLYGAGNTGEFVLPLFADDQRFAGFCSKTKAKQQHGYLGYPVISPEELLEKRDMSVVISAILSGEEIRQILEDAGYPSEQIYLMESCVDDGQYFSPDFLKYEEEEVFVDAGCYNLESSLAFRKYCGHVKKVYAFEPDPVNYMRCLTEKERHNFAEVELLPYGTWSKRDTLCFKASGTAGAKVDHSGDNSIPVISIDEVVSSERGQMSPKDRVTMVKMDVEGAELESLKGAEQTILRDKPKLAISIYHKPEDLVTIPLYIKTLVPDYKLYLRHHSNINSDTVLYAVLP